MSDALPPEVRALLDGPAATMAHVEALLLLRRVAPAPRDAAALAAETSVRDAPTVRRALDDLVAARLLAPAGRDAYRYAADAAPDRDAAVAALQRMYDERPVTLVRALYERPTRAAPSAAVQALADAFRLRER